MKCMLKEKIYSSEENEEEQLKSFFQEFVSRKRGDTFEEGLNGGIVIAPNKWAAKINEEDGKAYHVHTNMKLVRFLNGETNSSETEIEAGRYAYKGETRKIMDEDIAISLLSNKNECRIFMFCYNNKHSLFQLSTLKKILSIEDEIAKEYSLHFEVGFFNSDGVVEIDQFTPEQKEKIENYLKPYEEGPKQLTKKRKRGKLIYG